VEIVKIDKFRVSWGNEWKKLGFEKNNILAKGKAGLARMTSNRNMAPSYTEKKRKYIGIIV